MPIGQTRRWIARDGSFETEPADVSRCGNLFPVATSGCIYCDRPTGSREHFLPACLGGRRTCRSIVCSNCNQRLGPLDLELGSQLGQLGAVLGVRRDHHKAPQPLQTFDRRLRRKYRQDHLGNLELAEPIIEVVGRGKKRRLRMIGSQSDMDRLLHLMRQVDPNATWPAPVEEEAIAFETLGKIRYGGRVFYRAVAKIALHVLAWKDPSLARDPGLRGLKDWIANGAGKIDYVQHDLHRDFSHLPAMRHDLVHRIVIAADAPPGVLNIWITFFGCLSVVVHLGTLPVGDPVTRVLDFDPLSELPNDLKEATINGVRRNPHPTRHTYVHEVRERIDQILQIAAARTWQTGAQDLVNDLNQMRREIPEARRAQGIEQRLRHEHGRVLSLMATVAKWAERWYPGDENNQVVKRIRRLVGHKRDGPKSVAPRTWKVVALVRAALAAHLARTLTYRPITVPELRACFAGLTGGTIAVQVMASAAGVQPPKVTTNEMARWLRRPYEPSPPVISHEQDSVS